MGVIGGRLEVWRDGCWGTVCHYNFGEVNARIACLDMGLEPFYNGYWNTVDVFGPAF